MNGTKRAGRGARCTLRVRLPLEVIRRIDRLAADADTDRETVLRIILVSYLHRVERGAQPS